MKRFRTRAIIFSLIVFAMIMSSCAGEKGILPVQLDGIGTDRQGEKIEDHLEDSNTGEVELIPRDVLFADPVRTSPSISPDGTKRHTVYLRMGMIQFWLGTWIRIKRTQ